MNIIIGLIIGYIIATIIARKKHGEKKTQSVRFSIGDHFLVLHYWVLTTILIVVVGSIVLDWNPMLLFGFAIGVIVQGIRYHDFLVLWYKKADESKIYAKYKKENKQEESKEKDGQDSSAR
jgi:uncharacterized membrane protein YesL